MRRTNSTVNAYRNFQRSNVVENISGVCGSAAKQAGMVRNFRIRRSS